MLRTDGQTNQTAVVWTECVLLLVGVGHAGVRVKSKVKNAYMCCQVVLFVVCDVGVAAPISGCGDAAAHEAPIALVALALLLAHIVVSGAVVMDALGISIQGTKEL